MRIWSLHPKYLDPQGLVALWRETLLAQKVLMGETRGYKHHPQLERFKSQRDPVAAVASYLDFVAGEAARRGYRFDAAKIARGRMRGKINVTRGQLAYEWKHLRAKLKRRSPEISKQIKGIPFPEPHPLFRVVEGDAESWEKQWPSRNRHKNEE
jgi:hypothetical protein